MPKTCWCPLRGILCPLLLLLIITATFIFGTVTTGVSQENAPNQFVLNCKYPKDAADSSACEQIKANSIAENSLNVSEKQLQLSIFSAAGLGLTILFSLIATLISIKATRYSQNQTKILREAMILDHRAWIKIELESRGPLQIYSDSAEVKVALKISNIGSSPAKNIHTNIEFIFYSDMRNIPKLVKEFADSNRYSDTKFSRFLLPADDYYRPWFPHIEGQYSPHSCVLVACVSYEVMNSPSIHQTVAAYWLAGDDAEHGNAKTINPEFAQFTVTTGGFAD